ncbi:MAG: AmmeMemoRadiSam system protein A [Rectinemataceae bacterium]
MLPVLDDSTRRALLALARSSIRGAFRGIDADEPEIPPGLAATSAAGAFVTLKRAGRLRGCIGRMEGGGPLPALIVEMARAAAFEDPRFRPLGPGELDECAIEITLLGPRQEIGSVEAIELGRHGVWLSLRGRSAVFLPQVATEQGWNRKQLLDELALKAGLPPGSWADEKATLMIFEGFVFGESGD